eukprot:Rhum_TRINITY_DN5875_c0_g1::Rhum_TRINITY_DN5875_c0_g1_i1::g.18462::m.18462
MAKRVVANVTSDILCPWCWVGKRCLERAVTSLNSADARQPVVAVEVRWHPYFLHKDVPSEGVDKLKHYANKFGKARAKKLLSDPDQQVRVRGRAVDIEFNWSKGTVLSNSMKGHTLLMDVLERQGADVQNRLMEILFRKYFTENLNVGDVEVLAAAAREAGVAGDEASWAAAYEDARLVQAVEAKHVLNGSTIQTVPTFEFTAADSTPNVAPVVTGASDVAEFETMLRTKFL